MFSKLHKQLEDRENKEMDVEEWRKMFEDMEVSVHVPSNQPRTIRKTLKVRFQRTPSGNTAMEVSRSLEGTLVDYGQLSTH